MASKNKLSRKLADAIAKRRKHPRPTPVSLDPVPEGLMHEIVRKHLDVLQNIEFVFTASYREDPELDDLTVMRALRAVLFGYTPDDEPARELVDGLHDIRIMRDDITDEVWQDALRVVADSVRNHSKLSVGDTEYLEFIDDFIV